MFIMKQKSRSDWALHGINAHQRVVFIVDRNTGRKSITNDAENVVYDVNVAFPGWRIIYRDTQDRWDELVHTDGVFVSFKPLPPCFEPEINADSRLA